MEKTQLLKQRTNTHKPGFATLLFAFIILVLVNISFSSCSKNESEDYYITYGTVEKPGNDSYLIKSDEGFTLDPKETNIHPSRLRDSMRLIVKFSILEELDSVLNVKIDGADTILTKFILPYEESILDSMGNDPVKITRCWIVNGFINFEFMYLGGSPYPLEKHMINLLHKPVENGILPLEFRHNAFKDALSEYWRSVVSFPVNKLITGLESQVKIQVKYQESANSTKTIELTLK